MILSEENGEQILGKTPRNYNVDVWKVNACFNSFFGEEIKIFVNNIPLIIDFMNQ